MSSRDSLSPYALSFFDRADFVTVFVSYFDASENGGVYTVGGLLFRKKHIRPFEHIWKKMLKKFQIPHFHMTDCNVGEGIFAHLTEDECIECAAMAIDAVATFALKGTTRSVRIRDFEEVVTDRGFLPSAYAACAYPAMMDLFNWADKNDKEPRLFYVFEAGEAKQGDVQNLLSAIAQDEGRRDRFRYEDHAFLPKEGSMPTQGADIVAWHGAKHVKRRDEGITRLRGDFNALVSRLQITDGDMSRDFLQGLQDMTVRHAGEHGPQLAQWALLRNRSNKRRTDEEIMQLLRKTGDR